MLETSTDAGIEEEQVKNVGFNRTEVYELAKKDLNFLAALCLVGVFEFFFPEIHLLIWRMLCEAVDKNEDFSKYAIGLPRGHAKTTLLKLFVIYCILFTDRQFILIVCASDPLAVNFLADIVDILDSDNIKTAFGDWRIAIEKDTENQKKFSFMGRDIILAATGKGAVRGLNVKNRRPDEIIMDDFQKEEESHSETQADKDLRWMLGTLMKLKSPRRCLFVYIGNMYASPGCILRKLKENRNWISFIVGAILSDGKPIWPELHSLESLWSEFENDASMGKPEIFFAEVMNDPDSGVTSVININNIPQNPYEDDPDCAGRFVIIDVATDKITADDTTIAGYGMYGTDIVQEELEFGSYNPADTIKAAFIMAFKIKANLIAVEDVAYQSSLLFWFNFFAEQLHITGIEFVPVSPRGQAKNHRINQWLKRILPSKNEQGVLEPPREYLAKKVRTMVTFQIGQYKPLRRDNKDDILDNAAYAEQVIERYGPFIAIHSTASNPDWENAKVIENNSAF